MLGHIVRATCIEFVISKSELIGPKRDLRLVRPRQIGMVVAKELTGASLPGIGRAFGGRDHTTVLHGMRRIADLIDVDPRVRADLLAVRARAIRLAGGPPEPPAAVAEVIEPVTVETGVVEPVSPLRTELTQEEIVEAKKLKRIGWSVNGLARRYGAQVDVVCDAVGERDWKAAA